MTEREDAVLFEGRARGYPPVRGHVGATLAVHGAFVALAVTAYVLGVLALAGSHSKNVETGTLGPRAISLSQNGIAAAIPSGPPLPFWITGALVASELYRIARWRSSRYSITPLRIVVAQGPIFEISRSVLRAGGERASVRPSGVVVEGTAAGDVFLAGLDETDVADVSRALETFDGESPGVPSTQSVAWRRPALLLTLLVAVAVGGFLLTFDRVSVDAEWPLGQQAFTITAHSPGWGARVLEGDDSHACIHVTRLIIDGHEILRDDDWRMGDEKLWPWGAFAVTNEFERSVHVWLRRGDGRWTLPPGAKRLRVEGHISLEEGRVPFAFDLEPGGRASLAR